MEQTEMSPISHPDKKKLREFSKKYSPSERAEAAQKIKETRREYFAQKKNLSEEIQRVVNQAQEKGSTLSETIEELRALQSLVEDYEKSSVLKILNYFKIKKLREEMNEKSLKQQEEEKEYEDVQALIQELSEQKEEKTKLEQAKLVLKDFYSEEEEKWKEYIYDEKVRDIKNISKELNVWFIHGIHPNFVPDSNSLLFEGTDWETKLKIVLSLNPTLSTSTITEGDTAYNMWARMGVILSSGSVVDASSQDAGTIASSLGKRASHGFDSIPIGEKISKAVTNRSAKDYNEFVVEDPKIFGFYICLDGYQNLVQGKPDIVSHEQIFEVTRTMGIPVLVIEQGVLYKTMYDESTKKFVKGEKIDVGTSDDFEISDMEKQELIADLLVDSPFKIKSPEVAYVDSRDQGRKQYFEINTPKDFQKFPGEEIIFDTRSVSGAVPFDTRSVSGAVPEENARVKVVSTFPVRGGICRYILAENGLFRISENFKTGKIFSLPVDHVRESIDIGWNVDNLGIPLQDNETYLLAMEKHMDDLKMKRDELVEHEKYPRQIDFYDDWLKKLAFHLYGFGEQAGVDGNLEVQEKTLQIAKKFLSTEIYTDVIERRVDEHGRFKIQKEDILL